MQQKRMLAGVLSAALLIPSLSAVWQNLPVPAKAAVSYPVQYFRLGMSDTDNNINAAGSAILPDKNNGTAAEKWSVNYVSSGVFEIVSAENGMILTANGSGVSLANDTDGANQRWKIEGVQKDYDGYDLYYKITSNADTSKALTFREGIGFSLSSYAGDGYQKYKLNLDGLEGFAANAKTASGEKAGTIGGLLGEVVYVSTADDLIKQLDSAEPKTVVLTADIDMQTHSHTRLRDNKTLVGCYGNHTLYDPYFRTNNEYGNDEPSDNIIFRNLKMIAKNCPNRIMINVWSSRQIWIDHIFFDNQLSYDRTGNGQDEVGKFIWINTPYDNYMDAKDRLRSPDYVTISYCHLKKRYWTVAYGTQNDEITRDRTTLLYNWWDENVRRCPQLGNGSAHIYNNYYSAYGKDSNGSGTTGIIGGDGSEMLSQNNMFNGYTKGQALTMGGDTNKNPARDDGSYLSEALNGTPSAINFQSKNTSKWYPEKTNYGYSLLDAYNTKKTDTKTFCTAYAGDQISESNMKYITDSQFDSWVSQRYPSPFLRSVTLKVKTGAVMDTAYSYTFRNVNSGLYLSVADGAAASGANVQQGSPADKAAYTWTLQDAGDGYYYIYTALNQNLCIDLPYGSADNGTSIGLWSNDESDARKFKFIDNGDGSYTICTKSSADMSCFGVISDSKEDGADVIQWTSTGNDSQKWIVSMVLDPLNGTLIREFDRLQSEYAGAWSIESGLSEGALVYGDREVTYTAVPDALSGAEYVRTPCDAKNLSGTLAEFTAAEPVTVYVALDSRVEQAPAWLSGWTKTDLALTNSNNVSYVLYAKNTGAGETVTLGENGQTSGCVNYTVIAAKMKAAGDLDGDGALTVSDAVLLQKWLLHEPGTQLYDWTAGELSGDGRLTAADLTLMKRLLMHG